MAITEHFAKLGAPLVNSRWSWGGIDQENKRVFLRVWQDHLRAAPDGGHMVRLAYHKWAEERDSRPGYRERIAHLDLIKNGFSGYLVMCRAIDPEAETRKIKSYESRDVLAIGEIVATEDDEWGTIRQRVPIRLLTTQPISSPRT